MALLDGRAVPGERIVVDVSDDGGLTVGSFALAA